MSSETFGKKFELEKVKSWDQYYINYNKAVDSIKDLIIFLKNLVYKTKAEEEKNKNNNNSKDLEQSKKLKKVGGIPTLLKTFKTNTEEDKKKEIQEKIQKFIEFLDDEIKKIYIFFSSTEKDIYQKINKKIQNKDAISNKASNDILKELKSIKYISELCKQLIIFIFWNIKALKNILLLFDNSTKEVVESLSYSYIKKLLSKNNSDLIYILNFKTLDETILALGQLSNEFKTIINKDTNFKQNEEQQKVFNDNNNDIKSNINEYNQMHGQIFNELSEWQKYLNVNLELPNSSNNSLFRRTSFIGDYYPSDNETLNSNDYLSQNINLYNEINEDNSSCNDSYSYSFDKNDIKILMKYKITFSKSLINDEFSKSSIKIDKILSKENINNLKFVYSFIFFYIYSYCIIITLLNKRFFIILETTENLFYFFGIIITLPILGNLLSLTYINKLIKYNFKGALLISLFFVLLHYVFVFFGIGVFYQTKLLKIPIILLCIGRVFLGLSSLKLLGKEYINLYIPKQIQIRSNQTSLKCEYWGYIISFFSMGIQNLFDSDGDEDIFIISVILLIVLNGPFLLIIIILAIKHFKDPSNTKFKILSSSFYKQNRKNLITSNMALEQNERQIIEEQETDFENANNITLLSGVNHLKKYSNKIEENKKYYLKTIFVFLNILLFTSQYTSENCLIFISIINIKDITKDNTDFKYGLFGNSICYLISLLLQNCFLQKISQKNLNMKILILISFISMIIYILDILCIATTIDFDLYNFLFIFNGLMIIISDFFKIITINLFIGLLPTENFDFFCFKSNNFVMISNKIVRLIPGLLTIFLYFSFEDVEKQKNSQPDSESKIYDNIEHLNHFNINLGVNLLLFFLSFIYLVYYRNIKSDSFTRILYSSN